MVRLRLITSKDVGAVVKIVAPSLTQRQALENSQLGPTRIRAIETGLFLVCDIILSSPSLQWSLTHFKDHKTDGYPQNNYLGKAHDLSSDSP